MTAMVLLLACEVPNDTAVTTRETADLVERTGPWVSVTSTLLGSCALREDGTAACWGDDNRGQLEVPAEAFRAISIGPRTACGVLVDGSLTCWGDPIEGVPDGSFVSSLHACALDGQGQAVCWGEPSRTEAPEVSFAQISTGWSAFTCGLDFDGGLHCWGDTGTDIAATPDGTFVQVDVGQRHACALDDGGVVSCWGEDGEGQLEVIEATWDHVTAGSYHSCGVVGGGALCWGAEGQVNFGQVPASGEEFETLDAGGWHNCGVTPQGELSCWGDDHAARRALPSTEPVAPAS